MKKIILIILGFTFIGFFNVANATCQTATWSDGNKITWSSDCLDHDDAVCYEDIIDKELNYCEYYVCARDIGDKGICKGENDFTAKITKDVWTETQGSKVFKIRECTVSGSKKLRNNKTVYRCKISQGSTPDPDPTSPPPDLPDPTPPPPTYTYSWQVGTTPSCPSSACGGENLSSSVFCKIDGGGTVEDSFCPASSKPSPSTISCDYKTPTTCSLNYSGEYGKWIPGNIGLNPNNGSCGTYTINPSGKVNLDYSDLSYSDNQTSYSITCKNGDKTNSSSGYPVELDDREPTGTIEFKNESAWIKVINGKNWVNSDREIEYTTNDNVFGKNGSQVDNSLTNIPQATQNIWGDFFANFSDLDNGYDFQYDLWITDNVGNENPGMKKTKTVYFDNQTPTLTSSGITGITGTNNWTNSGVTLNFRLTDKYNNLDGSGIDTFELVEYIDGIKTNTITTYTCTTNTSQNKICYYDKVFAYDDNGKTFEYKIENLKDNVGNPIANYDLGTVKFDNIPPQASDITSIPTNNSFLIAKNPENFELIVDVNSGSPIVELNAEFEKFNDKNSYFSRGSITGTLTSSENISKVDGESDKESGNYRVYDYEVTKVCDEAANCATNLKTFQYNVLAGITNTNVTDIGDLANGTAIANGTNYSLKINLEDEFGNKITPVKDGTTDIRTVKIELEYDNNLHLNQYNENDSAVEARINSNSMAEIILGTNKEKTFDGEYDYAENRDGKYKIDFNVYTPTFGITDGREFIKNTEIFEITDIEAILEDNIDGSSSISSGSVLSSTINFEFKPIYNVTFSGSIKNNGLIEGAAQASEIKVEQNGIIAGDSDEEIFFEFLDISDNFDLNFQEGSSTYNPIDEEPVSTGNLSLNFNGNSKVDLLTTGKEILTLLTQKQGVQIDNEQTTSFSTYIRYILDGKTVIYPGEKIGQTEIQRTKQSGLNVIGYISNDIDAIITNTEGKDLNNIGNLTKLDFKKSIERNIYKSLRNIVNTNGNEITDLTDFSNNTDGTKLQNNNILYFKGGNPDNLVTLGDGNDLEIKGKKTIVVIGADLYIKSNMFYENKSDILGIIVLKDEAGIGGNVYIDPEVTNLVGTYYLSKTLKSGKLVGTTMKEFTNVNNISELKNQLHIFGNIFSENTIGGARKNPYKCPYFIKASLCNKEEAQKYDLNFLRRFVLVFKENNLFLPMDNGKVIGNGTCNLVDNDGDGTNDWTECSTNSKFARTVKNTDDPYARQSVIIEYNNNFLNNIPPLFEK